MPEFPIDAPKKKVIGAFELLGFRIVREREHIAMERENPDGTRTPLTLPNHARIKGFDIENDMYPGGNLTRRIFQGL